MRKIFVILGLMIVFLPFQLGMVITSADEINVDLIAFVEPDSGAEGSTFNYFFAAPYVQYVDKDGVCAGTMFSAIVFGTVTPPATPTEAESFIGQVVKESINASAVDSAVEGMKEAEFVSGDFRLPIYVTMPNVSGLFATESEGKEFCEYYINSLCSVFNGREYKNVYLKGMYFDKNLCDNTTYKDECEKICKEYNIDVLRWNDLSHIELECVPTEDDSSVINSLKKDYRNIIASEGESQQNIALHFDAYNSLHDCAVSMSELPGNPKAREVYEYIHEMSEGSAMSDASSSDVVENQGREPNGVEYAVYAFLAALGTACGIYLIVKCLRKAMKK